MPRGDPGRLDLRATTDFMLTPQMGAQPIPVEHVPVATGTVGLILGTTSLTMEGLIILPGIFDTQHSQRLHVLASSPQGFFSIKQGDCIAQVLLLPNKAQSSCAYDGELRPTDADSAFLMISLTNRPKLVLKIQGKMFEGILDTGADKSIISSQWWPKPWPVKTSSHALQGLGYQSHPTLSSASLHWEAPDGTSGTFTPYVLPLPVNLWGRDVLQDMGFMLSNEVPFAPSSQMPVATKMMHKMGFEPGKGLGKHAQGRLDPILPGRKRDRAGLGFS